MTHTNKIIAITGGIATGKSTVTNILKSKGYKVIDADIIARDLMRKGKSVYNNTLDYFGEDILRKDGEIDRKILGGKVFADPLLLNKLNNLTHPNIFQEIKRIIKDSSEKIIFLDIPLFFEVQEAIIKSAIKVDQIWLIYADRDTQILRLMDRDSFTKEEAIKRIDSQIPIDFKKEKAHRVIYNLDSVEELKEKINILLKDLS